MDTASCETCVLSHNNTQLLLNISRTLLSAFSRERRSTKMKILSPIFCYSKMLKMAEINTI